MIPIKDNHFLYLKPFNFVQTNDCYIDEFVLQSNICNHL